MSADNDKATITVAGVSFSAEQVKVATVTIDGRDIAIGEAKKDKTAGFQSGAR